MIPRCSVIVQKSDKKSSNADREFATQIFREFFEAHASRESSFQPGSEVVVTEEGHCAIRVCLKDEAAFAEGVAGRRNAAALFSLEPPYQTDASKISKADIVEFALEAAEEAVAEVKKKLKKKLPRIVVVPIHDCQAAAQSCWKQGVKLTNLRVATDAFRNYFGHEPALYLEWLNFYNLWLLVPAVLGVAVFSTKYFYHTTMLYPIFSIAVIAWGVLFVKFWERAQWSYAAEHGGLTENPLDGTSASELVGEPRPGFKGKMRRSPITGEQELFYPPWKRHLKQVVSWTVSLTFLAGCIVVQVCSLNLQGYMSNNQHAELEIPFFDQFAQPGRIFDPNGDYALLPVFIHVTVVLCLNMVFKSLAERLCEWENHRTKEAFESALIVKRVFFEFIDCYAVLFYVAFYRLDMDQLRNELISLYSVDQIRRIALETVLPYCWSNRRKIASSVRKKGDEKKPQQQENGTIDEDLMEYEAFDDYLEMAMQFGYVTMFAAAFPLAGLFSLVSNYIEIRSDCFKLCFVLRRPEPKRVFTIGPWLGVLKFFAFSATISNSLLFGFTSHNQMRYYFPWLFNTDGKTIEGEGRYAVAIVFLFEHLMVFLVLVLVWLIPSVPGRVVYKVQRLKYLRTKKIN